VLDALPWPWGEDLLAALFGVVAVVRRDRWPRARAWAAAQGVASPARLAFRTCAFRGRWVARSSLLGLRDPDALVRDVELQGREHLAAAGPTILLGFHLGPPNADIGLRALGYRASWLGSVRSAPAWSRPSWAVFADRDDNLTPLPGDRFWAGSLYRALRVLRDEGTVFVIADAWSGRLVFDVPLAGARLGVRGGWLSLARQAGARVVPVLTHLAGRRQVIVVHPALPKAELDTGDVPTAWREILTALVQDYVRQRPEQCPVLLFPVVRPGPAPGARDGSPR
jgi:lauroyl/myristoyl acyltransferase